MCSDTSGGYLWCLVPVVLFRNCLTLPISTGQHGDVPRNFFPCGSLEKIPLLLTRMLLSWDYTRTVMMNSSVLCWFEWGSYVLVSGWWNSLSRIKGCRLLEEVYPWDGVWGFKSPHYSRLPLSVPCHLNMWTLCYWFSTTSVCLLLYSPHPVMVMNSLWNCGPQ